MAILIALDPPSPTPRELYIRTTINLINDYCRKWHSGIPENQERIYRCQIEMNSKCAFEGASIKADACEAKEKIRKYNILIRGIDQQDEPIEEVVKTPSKPVLKPGMLYVIWSDGRIEDLKNPPPLIEPSNITGTLDEQ